MVGGLFLFLVNDNQESSRTSALIIPHADLAR
jgi:hypothetical protein